MDNTETLRKNRSLVLFEGIAFLILGILAIALPGLFTFAFVKLLGWLFLFGGLIQAYRTFKTRHSSGTWASALSALLSIVVCFLLLSRPIQGALTLTILLTIMFFLEGIFKIFMAASLRQYINWGWVLLSGILSLAMAAIIYSGWPGTATWLIGLLVGINMLFFGYSLIILYSELGKTPAA